MSKRALPNRLVIAEDSDDDYEFTSRALQKMGGDTLTLHRCHDGQELLDYLATEVDLGRKPDLILLDLNMPRVDGRTALEAIKKNPATQKIPTLILSSSANPTDVNACYGDGANSYVQKPMSFAELGETMRQVHEFWLERAVLPAQ